MGKENNRVIQGAANAQPRAANHSQENITSLGTQWVNAYQPLQEPMALKTPLRRSRLSHSFITCRGDPVGRADQEVWRPIAVKTRLSNLVIIYI